MLIVVFTFISSSWVVFMHVCRFWPACRLASGIMSLSFWQNIEYIVPTFASGCQYATYCNICKGWRGSTSHMLSIFARVRQGPACGQKPSNMGSENSSKSLRKRFQTTLNRLKSLDILDFGTATLGRYSICVNICKWLAWVNIQYYWQHLQGSGVNIQHQHLLRNCQ